MDWQLCLKPASLRPQHLCELNVNAALDMLCKCIERLDGWRRERKTKDNKEGGRENREADPRKKNTIRDLICSL